MIVRLDDESRKDLDAWVETGAVKRRSEAAAVLVLLTKVGPPAV